MESTKCLKYNVKLEYPREKSLPDIGVIHVIIQIFLRSCQTVMLREKGLPSWWNSD